MSAHGIGTAVVATTATFSLPVFLGIAIPALGFATGFTLFKNWQNNRDIKDFNTTVDIDTLGEKIAESVFYPVVYFLRLLRVKKEAIKENLVKDMVKDYGFDEEWARCRIAGAPFVMVRECETSMRFFALLRMAGSFVLLILPFPRFPCIMASSGTLAICGGLPPNSSRRRRLSV